MQFATNDKLTWAAEKRFVKFGMFVVPTICRTLKFMGCTRQSMHVTIQRSDILRATEILYMYDLATLIWLDETGCDGRRKEVWL